VALSDSTDQLVVHGGADDQVTITGAARSGTTTVGGEDYAVYSLGAGTVLIDEDVTVNTAIG